MKQSSGSYEEENWLDRNTPAYVESLVFSERFNQTPWGIMLRTKRGLGVIRWLGNRLESKRGAFDIASISLAVAGILGTGVFAWMAFDAEARNSQATEPANALAIPGVNDYLPVFAAGFILFALVVTMFVHEFGHAVVGESHGFEVEDWGIILLFGFIPFGAFVRSDVDRVAEAPVRDRLRYYSGGVLANWIVAWLSLY